MSQGNPYSDTRLTRFLETEILRLRPEKNQVAIAAEAGFVSTNMLSMIKAGKTRLPLDRVPALARALGCDPRYLFRLALEQAGFETERKAVEVIFGAIVTENEVAWLAELRAASGDTDPRLTRRARSAIRGVFGQ